MFHRKTLDPVMKLLLAYTSKTSSCRGRCSQFSRQMKFINGDSHQYCMQRTVCMYVCICTHMCVHPGMYVYMWVHTWMEMVYNGLSVDTGNSHSHRHTVALRHERHSLSVRIINLKLRSLVSSESVFLHQNILPFLSPGWPAGLNTKSELDGSWVAL